MKDPDCPSNINPIVWEMRKIAIEGNIVPHSSYSDIVTISEGGKTRPHLLAITIMAEIIYWYRPSIEVDDRTGIVSYNQKFHADKLQKSYAEMAKKFGVEKRQAKEACDLLRRLGLISIEFRTIEVSGSKLNNVIFIEPNLERLLEMLFQPERVVRNSAGGGTEMRLIPHEKKRGCPTKKRQTYTYNTTKNNAQRTTTTGTVVVVDDVEETEYIPDTIELLDPKLQVQARACVEKTLRTHHNWPSGKIYHAIWVLAHQVAGGYIVRTSWDRTAGKMILSGIEHRSDIPSPNQVRLVRLTKEKLIDEKKAAVYRRNNEMSSAEAEFKALSESEKDSWRSIFAQKTGITFPPALEAGAIAEFSSQRRGKEMNNG
jgi:hypothetical protein